MHRETVIEENSNLIPNILFELNRKENIVSKEVSMLGLKGLIKFASCEYKKRSLLNDNCDIFLLIQIIPLLAEEFFHVNSMHGLCHLASEGFSNEALELYLTIPKLTTRKDSPNAGCFILHSMIINGKVS